MMRWKVKQAEISTTQKKFPNFLRVSDIGHFTDREKFRRKLGSGWGSCVWNTRQPSPWLKALRSNRRLFARILVPEILYQKHTDRKNQLPEGVSQILKAWSEANPTIRGGDDCLSVWI
jgi:hypothetical protein